MGMVANWSCDLDHLNKLSFPRPKETPHEIWLQTVQWFQRRRCLKMLTTHTHTYIRTTEAYLSYKLTTEPKGSGELKKQSKLPFKQHHGPSCKHSYSDSKHSMPQQALRNFNISQYRFIKWLKKSDKTRTIYLSIWIPFWITSKNEQSKSTVYCYDP